MKVKVIEDIEQGYSVLFDSTRMKPIGDIFYEHEDIFDFLNQNNSLDYNNSEELEWATHKWRINNINLSRILSMALSCEYAILLNEEIVDEKGKGCYEEQFNYGDYTLTVELSYEYYFKQTSATREQPSETDSKLIYSEVELKDIYDNSACKWISFSDEQRYLIENALASKIKT